MSYMICLEEVEGQWIAHVPDLPGCFVTHKDRDLAIKAVPSAVEDYVGWAAGHGLRISGLSGPSVVSEIVREWEHEDEYLVNAFFAADRPPVLKEELREYEALLGATRRDLLRIVEGLETEDLTRTFEGERWPIEGILQHVANAEWWYLDRLGLAFARQDLPEDPFRRLEMVRKHTLATLPRLVNWTGVVTLSGETWSARKVLRRALWHERDHTNHIRKLKARLRQGAG